MFCFIRHITKYVYLLKYSMKTRTIEDPKHNTSVYVILQHFGIHPWSLLSSAMTSFTYNVLQYDRIP